MTPAFAIAAALFFGGPILAPLIFGFSRFPIILFGYLILFIILEALAGLLIFSFATFTVPPHATPISDSMNAELSPYDTANRTS